MTKTIDEIMQKITLVKAAIDEARLQDGDLTHLMQEYRTLFEQYKAEKENIKKGQQ